MYRMLIWETKILKRRQISTKFGNAIYNYEWYDLPATESKFFLICMTRTKKPQCLTSGKFAVLSLTIFTDIVKTSMGYLSVMRTFV
ncbi:odorant receptor 4-like [Vespula maculifrons]|uniref:Odorant receptor 4-like n=1 Tax=Vespula maculifrons TaxID=7453 RepID=A0ABD2BPJ4_VESMC